MTASLTSTPSSSAPLAERLKLATRTLHVTAERSAFMGALLGGRLSVASYRRLLVNLQAIYVALESALDRHRRHPAVAPIWLDGLARAPALAGDLAGISRGLPTDASALCPSTVQYVERLHDIGRDAPALLVAHAYVRYLGDLSGGQILGSILGRTLQVPTAFYAFGSPEAAEALKAGFRTGLEQVTLDAALADAVVAEAIAAFERHVRLFAELQGVTEALDP